MEFEFAQGLEETIEYIRKISPAQEEYEGKNNFTDVNFDEL